MDDKNPFTPSPIEAFFIKAFPVAKKTVAKEIIIFFIALVSAVLVAVFFCFTQQKVTEELILDAGALVFAIAYPCRFIYKIIKWALKNSKSD